MEFLMAAMASSCGNTPETREETGLHHRIDATTHAAFARHLAGIDDKKTGLLR